MPFSIPKSNEFEVIISGADISENLASVFCRYLCNNDSMSTNAYFYEKGIILRKFHDRKMILAREARSLETLQ